MQLSLPQRIVFSTPSPREEEQKKRELIAEYSWYIPSGLLRFCVSGIVAFLIAAVSLFSWNSEAREPKVDFLTIEGSALIGTGDDFREFSLQEKLSSGMTLKTDQASRFSMLFFGKNIVRLDRGTEVVIQSFFSKSRDDDFLFLDLKEGSLWINTLLSGDTIRVKAGGLEIMVANAASLISRDDHLSVYADRHAVEGIVSSARFLVPPGMRFSIRESEITTKIDQLRYSKFKKEFLRFLSEKSLENDEWLTFNRQKDAAASSDAEVFLSESISARKVFTFSEASTAGIFQKYYYQWGDVFIVNENEEKAFQIDRYLLSFHKAEKFFSKDDAKNGTISLQIFSDNLSSVEEPDALREALREAAEVYAVVSPDDARYPLKSALREASISLISSEEKNAAVLEALRGRLYEVFDLVFEGKNTEAKRSFLSYKNGFLNVFRGTFESFESLEPHFFSEYELLHELLFGNDIFYDAKYFEIFTPLEKALISFASNDIDRYETRLAFINNKLRMLEKLAYLLKGNAVSRAKAVSLGKLLLDESSAFLTGAKSYDVAVFTLFSEKISSLQQLFRFFESRDFEILYDSAYSEESFREFQETEKYVAELREYLKNLSSGKPSRVQRANAEDFMRRVTSDFAAYNITIREIEPLEETNYRLFSIGSGSAAGKTFRAKYDREYELVYDLSLGDVAVTISGVHLKNLVSFIEGLSKSQEETAPSEVEEVMKPRSQEEEDFIRISLKPLDQRGIQYDANDVVILDFDAKRFWLSRAWYEDAENVVFSFEFDARKGSATKIFVETALGSEEVAGTYAIANLKEAVESLSS